jgi:hypothetical protein
MVPAVVPALAGAHWRGQRNTADLTLDQRPPAPVSARVRSFFCEAAAFGRLGGFSQDLYAGEEIDLFRRLKRVARAQRREIVILHRHPLRTSGRKAHLYTKRKHFAFMLKTLLLGGRNLRSRESCYAWYDGRR